MRITLTTLVYAIFYLQAFSQAPTNDLCANAITLSVLDKADGTLFYDLTGATASSFTITGQSCTSINQQDIWFQVSIPPVGFIFIDVNREYVENGFSNYSSLDDLTFEAYTGVCGGPMELVQDQFNSCEFNNFNGLHYEGTGILYIRVYDKNGGQDKFSIAAISVNESQNSTCQDAVELAFNSDCEIQNFATNYSAFGSWFSFEYPANTDYVNIQLIQRSFNRPTTKDLTLFSGDCQLIEVIDYYPNAYSGISIRNRTAGEIIYVKVDRHFSYQGLPFGICIFKKENDICAGAVELDLNAACQPIFFSSIGATPSLYPTDNINCGYYPGGEDVWLKATVPASGNITIELSNYSLLQGYLNTAAFEFYTGQCVNLTAIHCNGTEFTSTNQTHVIPFSNLMPGQTLFIRAMNVFGIDEFQACAYEEVSYPEICRLDLVKFLNVEPCDPATNTATAHFEVRYTVPSSVNDISLRFENTFIPLTSNPQTFSFDVPAQGQDFNHQNTRLTGGCSSNNYLHFISFTAPEVCFSGNIVNDECVDAIEIYPAANCEGNQQFTWITATVSPNNPPLEYTCSSTSEEDIWFRFTTTTSNDLRLYLSREVASQFFPYLDVYTGSCNDLTPWPNPICLTGNSFSDGLTFENLPVGQEFFIRMINCCSDGQADFSVCLIENCPSIIDITTPLFIEEYIYAASDQVNGYETISANGTVTFQGTNAVQLYSGFEVELNSVFVANLDGCN